MAKETERPLGWPLVTGGITAGLLAKFAPISYTSLATARSLGFLKDSELRSVLRRGLAQEAPDLALLLDTASIFDRDRDIAEELDRLSRLEPASTTRLWQILGRVIIDEYDDPNEAVRTLEDLYQWFDLPAELRPYTLFVGPSDGGYGSTQETVKAFDKFLRARGLWPLGNGGTSSR
jgi:hypothetical protein